MKQSKVRKRLKEGWLKVLRNLPPEGVEPLRKAVREILGEKIN